MSDSDKNDTKDEVSLEAEQELVSTAEDDFSEESEPYLGPAWAVVMFVLYLLKEAFPAEQYSGLWWFQIYIVVLVIAITIFTLLKRHQFYRSEEKQGEHSPSEKDE